MGSWSSCCTNSEAESQMKIDGQRKKDRIENKLEKIIVIQSVMRSYLAQKQTQVIKESKLVYGLLNLFYILPFSLQITFYWNLFIIFWIYLSDILGYLSQINWGEKLNFKMRKMLKIQKAIFCQKINLYRICLVNN